MKEKKEKILEREISEEMKSAYIDYAMSVIVSRAIPDVRDGLKPVQRRILFAMYEDGLKHNARFKKAATVVGATLGKYHPHGDQPVYEAAIRMAQNFTLRYPLIQGQGNIGSIDDPNEYAAMRYVEMKLSPVGEEMLRDIEKNTVDFVPNYDGTKKEPTVLPSPLPNCLLNGASGIAVGMATQIPPHNLSEVCDALIYLLEKPGAKIEEILKFIQGPDFPTGGLIFDKEAIAMAYSQGKGQIVMRGKAEILEDKKGRAKIIISEIPFQVQKSALLKQIANLVLEKKVEGIKDVRDESDREGMRIVIELQKGIDPQRILKALYKFTELQKTFYLNMVALVDGIQPKTLNLLEILNYFLLHRKEVILRKSKYDLERAKEREHILKGIEKCLGKIEEVVKIIKSAKDREEAREKLMKKFSLDKIQANSILETKLATLSKLERKKIEEELKETEKKIKELKEIISSPKKIKEIIKKELVELKEKFGDKRRTKIINEKIKDISEKDLIPAEEALIFLTQSGYIKRVDPKEFQAKKKGKSGILGMKIGEQDVISHFLFSHTKEYLLVFTDAGKAFKIPVYEIPKQSKSSEGKLISNFLKISPKEKVSALISLSPEDIEKGGWLFFATKKGFVKKTDLKEFEGSRKSGILAINLKKDDALVGCEKITGREEIILVTKNGQAIRFKEKEVRTMGRSAGGVLGIKLKDDQVIGMRKTKGSGFLLTITENGFGKKTDLKEFKLQKRGGRGIKCAKLTSKTGKLAAFEILEDQQELFVVSKKGKILKTEISLVPKLKRQTQGVKIMKLEEDDKVASAICI